MSQVRHSEFVAIAFLFTFALCGLDAHFFVVLLQCSQILTSFRELSFFHTFTHIPMHKGTLRVHQIELVVDSREHLSDRCCVADHAHCPHHLGQVTARDHCGRLVVDPALETSWRPVDELNCALGLDCGDGCIHILWNDVSSVHHAASHVLSMTRITLHHHCCR